MAGLFISIEGIDGAGTTTQTKLAADWLAREGRAAVQTAEPTGGAVGKLIRQALSKKMPGREGVEIEPELFALLFAADRLDHMATTVEPALSAGKIVVSDRCYLSSFAYQSTGCELDWIRSINRAARRADLIILLDLEAEAAFTRIAGNRTNHEVFEKVERMKKIRQNYLDIAETLEREGEQIITLDGSKPVDAVAREIAAAIKKII